MSVAAGPTASLAAVWFTYFASVGLFNPYAPLWFKDLGFSTLAIGAIAALQAWTRVLAPYAWGWLADHSGRRIELLRVASALAALASLGLLWPGSPYGVVAGFVFVLFLANGGVVPLAEAALSQHLSRSGGGVLDAARYGRVRVWGSIGFIGAVSLFGFVLQHSDIAVFPWLVTAVLALLVAASVRVPAGAEEPTAASGATTGVWDVLRRPPVAWFFAGVFLTVLAHSALYIFFSLYLDELGYGKGAVGMFWAVSVAAEIAFFWAQGRWSALMTPSRWLVVAAAASVLRFAATAGWADVAAVLVAAQLLHAVTFAAQHAACIALVHRHFTGRLRGRGQALYSMLGYGISGVVGGLAGGAISERWGFEAVFWAAAAVALAATVACRRAEVLDRRTMAA